MKNFLLSAFCFFAMQIVSCSMGTVEMQPGTTKFSIQNNSMAQLQNVKWNGTDFGHIGSGERSEREVSKGNGRVYFDLSGKKYQTQMPTSVEMYTHGEFTFIDNTYVTDFEKPEDWFPLRGALNAD